MGVELFREHWLPMTIYEILLSCLKGRRHVTVANRDNAPVGSHSCPKKELAGSLPGCLNVYPSVEGCILTYTVQTEYFEIASQ